MASGKGIIFSSLSESPQDSRGGGGDGITGGRAAGSGSGGVRGLSMAQRNLFPVSRLSESPRYRYGGGGDGITGGRAAGSGSGGVRGLFPTSLLSELSEWPSYRYGGGGDGITGGRASASGSGGVWLLQNDPYPLLPADCHDGCVPKEVHERLLKRLRKVGDELLGYCRDGPCTLAEAAMTWKATKVLVSPDRSKAEQHELLYGSPLSSHWDRKSGGGREPADRYQEDFCSHSGMGKGGGRPYGDGYDDLGSSSQPFRGEAVARYSLQPREGDWRCSCGFHNFAWRLHCLNCQGPLPEHMSGSRKGCSFPHASASSYAGPSADCRAPPVPPSHAPRARDIRKRSRSPTRGALPPKEYGGDLKMKRRRDD